MKARLKMSHKHVERKLKSTVTKGKKKKKKKDEREEKKKRLKKKKKKKKTAYERKKKRRKKRERWHEIVRWKIEKRSWKR